MKAEGIEYEERMELLEEVTYPKPLAELLEAAYDIYAEGHPWVADHELRPKSVVRDMYERAMTFVEYVGFYGLARSEGLVLRYLADAYKALRQHRARGGADRGARRPHRVARRAGAPGRLEPARRVGAAAATRRTRPPGAGARWTPGRRRSPRNVRAFRVLVRNALFRRVELAALRRWDDLGELDADAGWDADAWQAAMEAYFAEHDELGTGPDGARPAAAADRAGAGRAGASGRSSTTRPATTTGASRAEVDLAASDAEGAAVVRVHDVSGDVGGW